MKFLSRNELAAALLASGGVWRFWGLLSLEGPSTRDRGEQVTKYHSSLPPWVDSSEGALHSPLEGPRQDGTPGGVSGHLLANSLYFPNLSPSCFTSPLSHILPGITSKNYLHPHRHLRVCFGGTQMKTSAILGADLLITLQVDKPLGLAVSQFLWALLAHHCLIILLGPWGSLYHQCA